MVVCLSNLNLVGSSEIFISAVEIMNDSLIRRKAWTIGYY